MLYFSQRCVIKGLGDQCVDVETRTEKRRKLQQNQIEGATVVARQDSLGHVPSLVDLVIFSRNSPDSATHARDFSTGPLNRQIFPVSGYASTGMLDMQTMPETRYSSTAQITGQRMPEARYSSTAPLNWQRIPEARYSSTALLNRQILSDSRYTSATPLNRQILPQTGRSSSGDTVSTSQVGSLRELSGLSGSVPAPVSTYEDSLDRIGAASPLDSVLPPVANNSEELGDHPVSISGGDLGSNGDKESIIHLGEDLSAIHKM